MFRNCSRTVPQCSRTVLGTVRELQLCCMRCSRTTRVLNGGSWRILTVFNGISSKFLSFWPYSSTSLLFLISRTSSSKRGWRMSAFLFCVCNKMCVLALVHFLFALFLHRLIPFVPGSPCAVSIAICYELGSRSNSEIAWIETCLLFWWVSFLGILRPFPFSISLFLLSFFYPASPCDEKSCKLEAELRIECGSHRVSGRMNLLALVHLLCHFCSGLFHVF